MISGLTGRPPAYAAFFTVTFCSSNLTESIVNAALATTPVITVPSAVVIVSRPAKPDPAFATAYT